ncbi:MAG: sensor histidine kinase [Prevotella sp.]|nr:sensor histidine kinase [Prevotella sp.]
MKKIKDWPIEPTFLSLRQECSEDTANYNTDGIYYTDYIRGFLADLSHDKNIQNALSLFQFVPESFLPYDPNSENPDEITTDPRKATVILNEPLDPKITEILNRQGKKIIRIDSGTYVNNGELCDAFRECRSENTRFCFKQDSTVGLLIDEELNKLRPNSDEYRQRLEGLIAEYNQSRSHISKIKCEAFPESGEIRRLYVHYTCSQSRFEEHIFPIYAQERVIACLMFGQVGRESFNREESFKDYMKEMKEKDSKCQKKLMDITCVDENQWRKKVRAIVERIETFEERLEERIEHRNTRYLNDKFEEIEVNFREEVKNINIRKENEFSQFTDALNKAFCKIRDNFDSSNDGFIRMFALPISVEHEELVPVGWAGADFEKKNEAKFLLKELKGIESTLKISNAIERIKEQRRIITEAASNVMLFDEKNDFLLPGWLAGNEVAYIVWKRHSSELRNKKNKKNFNKYRKALKNFYSIAQECYSYIRGVRMELLLETTIQESAHESAHFILPSIDVVENNLNILPPEMIVSAYANEYKEYRDSYERYRDEVLDSLNQLREINYGSSLIISKDFQINKKPEQVFYFLYKLKKLFSNKASDSHKDIFYSQKKDGVQVNIDAKYFNQALYNLLDNAIKYGYEGSYIRIKMDVDKAKGCLNITIVSYGIGIETGDRIYRLFERSEEASKIASGTGIGMYIVKKVCNAHGGDVTHQSELLSKYNIPVLINYKRNQKLVSSVLNRKIEFDDALSSLSDTIEKEVVCDHSFVKYSRVFSSRIDSPTYRNSFFITIPLY